MTHPLSLSELFAHQAKLNNYLKSTGVPRPDGHQLMLALMAEAGEFLQEIKWGGLGGSPIEGWCWWRRENRPSAERERVLAELVDMLHFLLSAPRAWQNDPVADAMYNDAWNDDRNEVQRPLDELILRMYERVSQGYAEAAVVQLVFVLVKLGFTRDELDVQFETSVLKNLQRWSHRRPLSQRVS